MDQGNWQRIPTLEEALDISGKAIGVILELKVEGIGNEACAIVKRVGFSNALIYASFLIDELHRVRQADSAAQIMVLLHRHLPPDPACGCARPQRLSRWLALFDGHARIAPDLPRIRTLYTVNDWTDIRRMRELGVDGIVSDYPDRI